MKRLCVHYSPVNLYMSVLNWLMPERVGSKEKANRAYPVGGEYVIDVDLHLVWRPHSHSKGRDGVCFGCLEVSKGATLLLLDKIIENYRDIYVVFSGKRGYHIHVLDFDVRDWTRYDERDPIKSHEVARFVYTKHVKSACGGFDDHHFTLSCDPMRVVTFPDSLNGETRLRCTFLGDPYEFEKTSISDVVWRSRANQYFFDTGFQNLSRVYSHLEPTVVGDDL